MIDAVDDDGVAMDIPIEEGLRVETLTIVIMNFESDRINDYDEMISTLHRVCLYKYAPKKLDFDF